MKKRFAANGGNTLAVVNQHPLVFPNMLRQHHGREHYLQYRVPVDDTQTLFFEIYFSSRRTVTQRLTQRTRRWIMLGKWGKATLEVLLAIQRSSHQSREVLLEHQVPCNL